ncbi:MAG: hypothetical protein FJY29_11435 [Betaproteobacteria bacterium]|nr:hypothetical protein [Betaproteobacteria bacterium]
MTLDIMAAIVNNSTRFVAHLGQQVSSPCTVARNVLVALLLVLLGGCASMPERRKELSHPVTLPFMRMEPGECYYLDDFMPTPDSMVSGKSSGLYLRYYTFSSAVYKVWERERVMLAFYSRDNRCWSLFEEYSTGNRF